MFGLRSFAFERAVDATLQSCRVGAGDIPDGTACPDHGPAEGVL